ncbi:OmpA family protein [Candidatus Manganitrophus noduliformans]|uniref:OmpA family protein n=1 Tax=Candidatus Manganitrophus noduliformans TaxID=2606439 RepID=A0A7X6DSZ8_9BACT|nr:OmpA family protein [Candidatus Manganitrophus noduliformans]NKE72841.1 OmpA family protein [Candidatus Manganitrophus noduliformans]
MKSIIFVLITSGILAGCAGTAKEETRDPYFKNRESPLVVPMRHPFPPSQGVAYLVSEQFFLCREKDFCPVPQQKFTERFFLPELPKPVREEPIVEQPAILKKRLPETIAATVLFDKEDATLTEETSKVLDELFDRIKEVDPLTLRIVIAGYTDGAGSVEVNTKLAEERAEAVADYFIRNGIPKGSITVGGRPLCCYVAPNDTEEGRGKNRRVEVFVEQMEEEKSEKKN